MIPLKYNVRNLRVRWVSTLMTVLGTGLVVWSSCILFGLVEGLQHSLTISGDPLDLIVLRKGSTQRDHQRLRRRDRPTTSPTLERHRPRRERACRWSPGDDQHPGRRAARRQRARTSSSAGSSAASPKLRPEFHDRARVATSTPGKGECIVSRSLSRRFKDAALGGVLKVGEKESYRVVGLFTAGGSAAESEVWVDFKDLARNINREGSVSSVQLRAASTADLERIKKTIDDDTQFKLAAAPRGGLLRRASRSRASSSRWPGR